MVGMDVVRLRHVAVYGHGDGCRGGSGVLVVGGDGSKAVGAGGYVRPGVDVRGGCRSAQQGAAVVEVDLGDAAVVVRGIRGQGEAGRGGGAGLFVNQSSLAPSIRITLSPITLLECPFKQG